LGVERPKYGCLGTEGHQYAGNSQTRPGKWTSSIHGSPAPRHSTASTQTSRTRAQSCLQAFTVYLRSSADSDAAIGARERKLPCGFGTSILRTTPFPLEIVSYNRQETYVHLVSRGPGLKWAHRIAPWPRKTSKQEPHIARASINTRTLGTDIPRTIDIQPNQKTDCKSFHQHP